MRSPRAPRLLSFGAERDGRRLDAAVAAVALLVGDDGFEQMAAAEVGPERLGDPDLGIRDLPQQEVAHAHLAARANQQIGIRLPRRVEEVAEAPLVEIVGVDAGGQHALRRVEDLGAAAVVERDVEQHAGVVLGLPDADLELVPHVLGQFFFAADHAKADVVLEERAQLRSEEHTSELQSPCNLVCRLLLEKKKKKALFFLLYKKKIKN